MPQSLIQLPKTAHIKLSAGNISIKDHKVTKDLLGAGLFGLILSAIKNNDWNNALPQVESCKISFEAFIETCVKEIEDDVKFGFNLLWNYPTDSNWSQQGDFVSGRTGKMIAEQFIEKIRSCENWDELYTEMHPASMFQKEMKNKITRGVKEQIDMEMRQQCRKA